MKQHRGNVFVPPAAPQYAAVLARTKGADPLDWRRDETRPGLWVPYHWIVDPQRAKPVGFSTFTEEQLRELYPQPQRTTPPGLEPEPELQPEPVPF